MKIELNPQVDKYLIDGCMRCKYGATPQCKVHNWPEELESLRQIVLESGLKEELKWGVPVYTHNGKNVITVAALKDYATLGFFKGVLLSDPKKILSQQGNLQSDRLIKFTSVKEIKALEADLNSYINEAIEIEESGKKVVFKKNPEPIPDELLQVFEDDPVFKNAFNALTLGRQRGYIIYFSQPKQSQTRLSRIEKYKQQIFDGIGFHDKYKSNTR
jgi:uncharacterized protein YdeI (YjbR/CyaY-like superfamily)